MLFLNYATVYNFLFNFFLYTSSYVQKLLLKINLFFPNLFQFPHVQHHLRAATPTLMEGQVAEAGCCSGTALCFMIDSRGRTISCNCLPMLAGEDS